MITLINKITNSSKEDKGFTLIELMLAIFIMTVGLVSTMKMMANFRDASLISRDQVTAINIGIRKVEDLLGKPFYYDFSLWKYVVDSDLSSGCHEDPDGNGLVNTCVRDSYTGNGGTATNANVYFNKFTVGWNVTIVTPDPSILVSDTYSTADNLADISLTVSWTYHGTVKSVAFRTLKSAN